jgi:hypothetical protein
MVNVDILLAKDGCNVARYTSQAHLSGFLHPIARNISTVGDDVSRCTTCSREAIAQGSSCKGG